MSKKVLIIDDEPAVAEAMAELVRDMQLEAQLCTDVAKAVATFDALRPELVILDLMLPGTDGMKLGAQLRKRPGGAQASILAVSGVFKQASTAKELWTNLQADFIAKPFDNTEFQSKVAARLGLPPPGQQRAVRRVTRSNAVRTPTATNFSSEIAKDPVYRLLVRLYEHHASGHLLLRRGKAQRRITFHMGQIRHASSNLAKENAGGLQVARGLLQEEAFRKAVAHARAKKSSLLDALIATKAMNASQASRALAQQVHEVSTASLGWADGQASFQVDPAGAAALPDHRNHPVKIVIEGVGRYYPPASIKSFLDAHAATYVQRSLAMERETYTLQQAAPRQTLIAAIHGQVTLGALIQHAREEDLPLLFALVGSGLLHLSATPVDSSAPAANTAVPPPAGPATAQPAGGPPSVRPTSSRPAAAPQAVPQAAPMAPPVAGVNPALSTGSSADAAALDAGKTFRPEEQEARQKIGATHKMLMSSNFYELLGVSPGAKAEAIQEAYIGLARTWHSDRFSGLDLGSCSAKLEALFSRIGEARETLSDKDKRAEYDVFLDRQAKGLPTDVAAVLKAEDLFQRAELLIKSGKHEKALPLLDQAIELNHAEPEFHAFHGYASYRCNGSEAAARDEIEAALRERPKLACAYYFLGAIDLIKEDLDAAEQAFKKALSLDPKHSEATTSLRLIERKRAPAKKGGGLFGRFRSK